MDGHTCWVFMCDSCLGKESLYFRTSEMCMTVSKDRVWSPFLFLGVGACSCVMMSLANVLMGVGFDKGDC